MGVYTQGGTGNVWVMGRKDGRFGCSCAMFVRATPSGPLAGTCIRFTRSHIATESTFYLNSAMLSLILFVERRTPIERWGRRRLGHDRKSCHGVKADSP